jgi:hypothetical protein
MSVKDCLHSACSCRVSVDELFCSASCREAARNETPGISEGCDCAHQGCLGHAGKRHEESRGEDLLHAPEQALPPQRRSGGRRS